ncbi:hypothetical protein Q3G72_031074 [Acer saccharum]|nr:hypothetical protein Q3G72_031074 [Acer saccharum]
MCEEYKMANYYASPAHPQTNGQTEAVNKVIKHTLKAKLEAKKGSWADKLPVPRAQCKHVAAELRQTRGSQGCSTSKKCRVPAKATRYYNFHVRERRFQLGDLVLRRVSPNTKDKSVGSLADK